MTCTMYYCIEYSLSLSRAAAMYALSTQSVERSWNTRTVKRQSLSPPPVETALSNGHQDDLMVAAPPKKKVLHQFYP